MVKRDSTIGNVSALMRGSPNFSSEGIAGLIGKIVAHCLIRKKIFQASVSATMIDPKKDQPAPVFPVEICRWDHWRPLPPGPRPALAKEGRW
jgi:hypothetical protein